MNVSIKILVFIVFVFILQLFVPGFTELFYFNPAALNAWMFVSSIFLHGSLTHLLFNGFALLIFGPFLENKIGEKNFFKVFLLAGIIGNCIYLATILIGIIPPMPALGASGAIYGILGMLAVVAPETIVYTFFVPMPIRAAAVFWIIIEFLGSFNANSGIGSAAHLGGLVFGILYGMNYKKPARTAANGHSEEDEKWEKELREH